MTNEEIKRSLDVIDTHLSEANNMAREIGKEAEGVLLKCLLETIISCTNAAGVAITGHNWRTK